MILDLADVQRAALRLQPVVHRTPVFRSRQLDARAGAELFLKAECLQRAGAFKIRGAYNKLATLEPGARARGVVSYSSGNHAQGVPLAAQKLGVTAIIVMPATTPKIKVDAVAARGAQVILHGDNYDDACLDAASARLGVSRMAKRRVVPTSPLAIGCADLG